MKDKESDLEETYKFERGMSYLSNFFSESKKKECGNNGCGGKCGTCTGGKTSQNGKCVTGGCWPDCPEMVTVPVGKFWMGCNKAVDNKCANDEYPYHILMLMRLIKLR